jgi:hypothetical protein
MDKCNHTIAFEYGEEYGSSTGSIISLSYLESDPNYLKNNVNNIQECNFCPHCGEKLEALIKKTIKKSKSRIKKEKEEKERKLKAKKEAFAKKVSDFSERLKFNKLTEDASYHVIFFNDGNKRITIGQPDFLARSIINDFEIRGRKVPDHFKVDKIIKCPTFEVFQESCEKMGWERKKRAMVKKTSKYTTTELEYHYNDGIVYVTEIYEDSDGDINKSYDRASVITICHEYSIDIDIEVIDL